MKDRTKKSHKVTGHSAAQSRQGKKHLAQAEHFAFSLQTNKSLGQHFLTDTGTIQNIVSAAAELAGPQKKAFEIGPGSGAMTKALLNAGWQILAIEKDARAHEGLQHSLLTAFPEKFCSICSDILCCSPQNVEPHLAKKKTFTNFFASNELPLCLGNLPYYITSDILFWYLKHAAHFRGAVFMVQDEVAERLAANPGNKDYGRLSARLQLVAQVEKILFVPAKAFSPPPKVNSAVVRIIPKPSPFQNDEEVSKFEQFTALLFSARRKMLRRTLAPFIKDPTFWESAAVKDSHISPEARPETLPPESLLFLFRCITRASV